MTNGVGVISAGLFLVYAFWGVLGPPQNGDTTPAREAPARATIVFERCRHARSSVWVALVGVGKGRRLPTGAKLDMYPRWSPDGTTLAFSSFRPGSCAVDVFVMRANGTGLGTCQRF